MILLDVTHGIATCKAAHRNALVLAGNPIGFMGKIRKHDILFKANMTVKSIIYQKKLLSMAIDMSVYRCDHISCLDLQV